MILIYLKNWCFETNKNKWCKHKTIIILMYFWQIPNLAAWYFWSDIYSYCFFLISLVKWKLISSVHVLRFSEGAAPCPSFKSEKCALPFLKSQNCTLPSFKSQNCALPSFKIQNCALSFFRSQKCTLPFLRNQK